MITRTQWKVSYDHAHKNAADQDAREAKDLLGRYIAGWDFRNKLEESDIKCPAPMSDSILIEGNTNIFEIHIEIIDVFIDTNDLLNEISVSFNDGYHADLYAFYSIDKNDEPWEPKYIRIASEKLLTHHGEVR